MESLGIVEEITCDGRLIVRCKSLPNLGEPAFDSKHKRIGVVRRVFGPVEEPYASITPENDVDPMRLRGTETFYNKGKEQNGKTKRRNRRD